MKAAITGDQSTASDCPGAELAVSKVPGAQSNNVFIFLRGFYEDPKNLTPAVTHLERTKFYPLNGEATAKPMKSRARKKSKRPTKKRKLSRKRKN